MTSKKLFGLNGEIIVDKTIKINFYGSGRKLFASPVRNKLYLGRSIPVCFGR